MSRSGVLPERIGVCTWTFGSIPLERTVERVARLGFGGVELHGDLEAFAAPDVRELLSAHGLEVFSLTPANVDIAHPDEGIRGASVAYYERLVEFAHAIGAPLIGCHGLVSRVRPIGDLGRERELLVDAVRRICRSASSVGVRVAFEVLNRYESCHVNTGAEALAMLDEVHADNLGVLLDAYHMNIEEPDPAGALRAAGHRLTLFHLADSNREGLGRGHVDVSAHLGALEDVGYDGPIILECTAPGPDPFTPDKGPDTVEILEDHLASSLEALRS